MKKVRISVHYKQFGLGFRYSNWAPKRHFIMIDIFWLTISINL